MLSAWSFFRIFRFFVIDYQSLKAFFYRINRQFSNLTKMWWSDCVYVWCVLGHAGRSTLLISQTNTCTKLIPIMSSRLRPLHLLLVRMLRSCIPTFRFFQQLTQIPYSRFFSSPAIRNTHGTGWRVFADLNAFKKRINDLLDILGWILVDLSKRLQFKKKTCRLRPKKQQSTL